MKRIRLFSGLLRRFTSLNKLDLKQLFLWKFKKLDCFGTKFLAMTVQRRLMQFNPLRHCDERSEEAIQVKNFINQNLISRNIAFLFLFSHSNTHATTPLHIVGSSAVFPFAATVAEHFGHKSHAPIPLVEAIGTGAGIKLFCGSKGPDGAITSRAMTRGEVNTCKKNGVQFEEFKIGQDGLVLVQNKQGTSFGLTLFDLRHALSEKIRDKKDCVQNPYKTWREIQKNFPNVPIRVLGPAPTSGTYDVLLEKIEPACDSALRQDGVYIEAPANENLIIQKVLHAPSTIGIITFSFYEQNKNRLDAFTFNTVPPSFRTIQQGIYPLSRPLYLYIKTNDIQDFPARAAYGIEFTSQEAVGAKGYLNEKGLIPLSSQEQEKMHARALALTGQGEL